VRKFKFCVSPLVKRYRIRTTRWDVYESKVKGGFWFKTCFFIYLHMYFILTEHKFLHKKLLL